MLALVEYPTTKVLRHLGREAARRHFVIFINNVEIERLDEDTHENHWADGDRFTALVESRIAVFEKALAVTAVRSSAHDYELSQ
jgi:hypothetical protein